MPYKFTKLNVGSAVKTVGNYSFKKLFNTPVIEAGTYILKLNLPTPTWTDETITFYCDDAEYTSMHYKGDVLQYGETPYIHSYLFTDNVDYTGTHYYREEYRIVTIPKDTETSLVYKEWFEASTENVAHNMEGYWEFNPVITPGVLVPDDYVADVEAGLVSYPILFRCTSLTNGLFPKEPDPDLSTWEYHTIDYQNKGEEHKGFHRLMFGMTHYPAGTIWAYHWEPDDEEDLGWNSLSDKHRFYIMKNPTNATIRLWIHLNARRVTPEDTKLPAPTISLNGSILSITNNSDIPVRYRFFKDGSSWLAYTTNRTDNYSVDLSTVTLDAGTYSICLKAFADGYTDSEPSNVVEYVV